MKWGRNVWYSIAFHSYFPCCFSCPSSWLFFASQRKMERPPGSGYRDRSRDHSRGPPRRSSAPTGGGGGGRGFYSGDRRGPPHHGGGGYQSPYGGGGGRDSGRRGDHQGGSRTNKRPRYDDKDDVESRLTALIVRIGDKSASPLEANLQGLAEALEGDLAHHGPQITSMLFNWFAPLRYLLYVGRLLPFCFVFVLCFFGHWWWATD